MSYSAKPKQTAQNPFIRPDSQYRCAVPDCIAHGVWSPTLNGSVWYCRQHADPKLPDPPQRWQPSPGPFTAEEIATAKEKVRAFIASGKIEFDQPSDGWWHRLMQRWRDGEQLLLVQREMVTRAWANAGRPSDWTPPDIESQLEREAIQAEGAP
jgi:hypothetical protein